MRAQMIIVCIAFAAIVFSLNKGHAQPRRVSFAELDSLQRVEQRNVLVFIHTDWCKYCQILKPEWEKMKTKLRRNMGRTLKNAEFEIVEMGDTSENQMRNITVDQLVNDFNKKHFPEGDKSIQLDGYATIFRITKKNIEYYKDEKDSEKLYKWATKI